MPPFNRRNFLRGFTALTSASLFPSLTRLARAEDEKPTGPDSPTQIARGRVLLDGTQTGVPNVRVSNGREFVATDAQGHYEIPVTDDTIIFVQKPAGYRLPLDELNQPRFYYIHKPRGTQVKTYFKGIDPTGDLPASVDFTLIKTDEPADFRVVLWADPQPRNIKEVDYVARDVASELVGVKAAFGVCLGDIAFNKLWTFRPMQDVTASFGIPWYSIVGNHDLNFDSPDEANSAETFKRHFGPTYYSFDYGQAHFISLDNVFWHGIDPAKGHGNYSLGFTEEQLTWLKNDLDGVPHEKLVVLFMHIPINREWNDRDAFLALFANRPHTLSISGHTHVQNNAFMGPELGWHGKAPHHHFNCGTVSGSWWSGYPDERGIPHTTMGDGTPNGYAFLNVSKNDYTIDWKCAGSSPDYQMNVTVPASIAAGAKDARLQVNVFNGSPKTTVEARAGNGDWTAMEHVVLSDPGYANFKTMESFVPNFAADAPEELKKKAPWIALPELGTTSHLWQISLPPLPAGPHWIEIRATDMWGRTCEEKRLVQVA